MVISAYASRDKYDSTKRDEDYWNTAETEMWQTFQKPLPKKRGRPKGSATSKTETLYGVDFEGSLMDTDLKVIYKSINVSILLSQN